MTSVIHHLTRALVGVRKGEVTQQPLQTLLEHPVILQRALQENAAGTGVYLLGPAELPMAILHNGQHTSGWPHKDPASLDPSTPRPRALSPFLLADPPS